MRTLSADIRAWFSLWPRRRRVRARSPRGRVALGLTLALLGGCSPSVGEPIAAGFDAAERDLAGYLRELHQAARDLPASAAIRGRLGIAYDANGFAEAAMQTYRQAAMLDADEFRWPYYLALLQATRGYLTAAVASVERALAIDPGYVPAWLHLGAWLLDLDRNDAAAQAYRRALALDADDEAVVVANAGLARVLLRQGRAAEALDLLRPLADLPHPHLQRLLARAYRQSGQAQAAQAAAANAAGAASLRWRDEHQQAKEAHVRGFHGLLSLAEQRLKRGLAAEAAAILAPLRETRPHDRTLLNNLSIAYKLTGRSELAFDVLQEGIRAHPDYYLFHFNLASLYEDRDRPQLAAEHFGRALELDPGLKAGYERLGLLFVRERRYDEALATFEAMAPHGESATALYYRAMIEGSRERWPAAVASLRRAVQLDPNFAKGFLFLGRSLAETGRFVEAHAALDHAERLGTPPQEVAKARAGLATEGEDS